MPSMSSLTTRLKKDYPDLKFEKAAEFLWSPSRQTVFYANNEPAASALLLHELAHALLDHRGYKRDIELLSLETDAWQKAHQLGSTYGVIIDEEVVQDHLDTYRDWLNARSTCPNCSANGYQIDKQSYQCPACNHVWRVNEARSCGLKRYSSPDKK